MVVCVYGASGWTGHQIASALNRLGIPLILAGRSTERCLGVAKRLKPPAPCRPATIDDPVSLRHAFRGARVVVNCAGPYIETGAPILSAALSAGASYVDTSGESGHIAEVYRAWDEPAKRAGVTVVPALAAKGAIGDWGVYAIERLLGRVPELVDIAYGHGLRQFFRPSAASALSAAGQGFTGGHAPEERIREVELPPPFGRGLALRVPGGEEITIPRHMKVRRVRTFISVDPGGPGNEPWARALLAGYRWLPLFGRVMMSEWGRWHARLYFPPPEKDHDQETFCGLIEGRAGDSLASIAIVSSDAYGVTAEILAYVVSRMLRGRRVPPGVRSPAQVVDPLTTLGALSDGGVIRVLVPQG